MHLTNQSPHLTLPTQQLRAADDSNVFTLTALNPKNLVR